MANKFYQINKEDTTDVWLDSAESNTVIGEVD